MIALLPLLAVMGAVTLLVRLVRAAGRLVLAAAEATAASGMAEASARRGDITQMQEGRATERAARSARRRALLLAVLWLAWLVVPLLTGWVREAYAAAVVLWMLPGARTPQRG